jgi:hypothetical protein
MIPKVAFHCDKIPLLVQKSWESGTFFLRFGGKVKIMQLTQARGIVK